MYLKDLSDPEKNSNKLGIIQFDFSRKVDFLISLLAKSGIGFSPFNHDVPQATTYLITLDEWRDWFNQTLAKSDPRWYWRVDDIEGKALEQIQQDKMFQKMVGIQEPLNWSAIHTMYVKRITWFDEQYRQVAQEYSTPDMNQIEESWMQDTRISQDWEVSLRTIKPNPNIQALMNTPTNYPSGEIDSIYKVYFVNYPAFVKYTIGINTIIGVPGEAGFNIQSVIDEIERLVRE